MKVLFPFLRFAIWVPDDSFVEHDKISSLGLKITRTPYEIIDYKLGYKNSICRSSVIFNKTAKKLRYSKKSQLLWLFPQYRL